MSNDAKAPLAGAEVADAAALDARETPEDAPDAAEDARDAAEETALVTALSMFRYDEYEGMGES